MNGLELIRMLAQQDGLPPPPVTIVRGPFKDSQGRPLRGAYNAMTHEIMLTNPDDLENAEHEYLHYRDHVRHGNPLATFICQDAACNYHMPSRL